MVLLQLFYSEEVIRLVAVVEVDEIAAYLLHVHQHSLVGLDGRERAAELERPRAIVLAHPKACDEVPNLFPTPR